MNPNFSKIKAVTAGKTKTSGISPFSELEISKVYPNPDQPRKQFDDIEELASTIKEHGLLQPITVVKKDDGYMIVSGERRYKAHLFNEAKTIKAYILDTTDEKVEELTFIENIQRNDLTDFETAKYIVKLWETGRYEKKSDLAKKIGKSESYISKAFSALKLNDEILEDIATNKKDISVSVMDEISRVKDKDVQKKVYQKYNAGEITRDDIKEYKEPKKKEVKRNILPNFIYYEPLKYEDGITLQSEFIDKNLPFKDINTIGQGAYGNKVFYDFNDIGATFGFVNLKIGDYCIESDSNEKYSLSITKVELPEDEVLLEDELSVIGEVHPESFSCIEFKKIKAYFYYSTLKNPDEFQGFRKGEKYKLVIKKIKNKIESKENETNHTLKKFEDAEKKLVDQAKNFTHNFPTGNLEATFKVGDLITETVVNKQERIESHFSGEIVTTAYKRGNEGKQSNCYLEINHGIHAMLENAVPYTIIIQDPKIYNEKKNKTKILEERVKELEKEIENLKENQTVQDNSILENDIKKLLTKEISIININKISNIFKTDDGKSIILDIEQSIKYFKNCKQKEFKISFIFESARKIFIDEVLGKLDDYVLNEDEKILFNNKTEIIKIIEVCESGIYIEYDNSDSETISYSKAKELIKKSTQKSIPYTISSKTEKAYDFINKMPNRTQENSNLILKVK